jgi:hypothetical protein
LERAKDRKGRGEHKGNPASSPVPMAASLPDLMGDLLQSNKRA